MNRTAADFIYTGLSDEPIRNGFVEYTDEGTVTAIGECQDLASETDFRPGAIMPGFVNSHCHLELSHLRGKFTKGSGMSGLPDKRTAGFHYGGKQEGGSRQVDGHPLEAGRICHVGYQQL